MRYFEQLPVGFETTIGTWQLTEADVIEFAKQWDPQPFHIDPVAAEQSAFGELVAS